MTEGELLTMTLTRLETKIDEVARDIVTIKLELAEKRGERKILLALSGILGAAGGAAVGGIGHALKFW